MTNTMFPTTPVSWAKNVKPVENRQAGLGGTDIAAILGLSQFKTPFDVYLEKTGKAVEKPESPAMKWGKVLEPVLAQEYSSLVQQVLVPGGGVYSHPDREWQIGSPDYLWKNSPYGVDCKTANAFAKGKWGEQGTDEVPDEYLLQMQWYISIFDAERWDIPVLIGGQDFRFYTINRNNNLIETILETAEKFWTKHIQADVPPEITYSEETGKWLKQAFPRNISNLRGATETEVQLIDQLKMIKSSCDLWEQKKNDVESQLKLTIGDADGIECDLGKITWKNNKDSQKTDWEALALSFNPTPQQVAEFTTIKEGARVMRSSFTK